MSFPNPRPLAPLVALLALTGCLSISKGNFDSTTGANGALKASDAAAHSRARIRREGSELIVQDVYRFDLATLVGVDEGYAPSNNPEEGQQTKDETIISMAIHGAFGMGTFNPVLDKLDSPWVKDVMAKTRVGKPFLVRSLSPKRDDYYLVPVFYKGRWAVSNHVGVTPRGTYYSNGFTVPNMPTESPKSQTAYGRRNLNLLMARLGPVSEPPERVWLETEPAQEDAVTGYCWLVKTATGLHLVDTKGRTATLGADMAAKLAAGQRLDGPIPIR